jgi:FKBP-type peptidyl-prolyl cis-trans isomerase FklB
MNKIRLEVFVLDRSKWWKKGVSMKFGWIAVLAVVLVAGPAYAGDQVTLKTQKDKVSYIIGINIGSSMKRQSVEVNPDLLLKGLKDGLSGTKPLLAPDEMRKTMTVFNEEMKKKHDAELKKLGAKNKEEGEKFLAQNKKKEGIVTLPSGLQYKIITKGKGKSPTINDIVTVNYRGTLIDGKEFDSSYKRGKPATFPVKGVIKGWTEALQLMKPGAKWELFIPPDLGYGARGAGSIIPPDSTLIFEVELLSVKEGHGAANHGVMKKGETKKK